VANLTGFASRETADRAVDLFFAGDIDGLRRMFDHSVKIAVSAEKIDDVRDRAMRASGRWGEANPLSHEHAAARCTTIPSHTYDPQG